MITSASSASSATDPPAKMEWKDFLEYLLPPQGRWSEEEYLVLTDHRNQLIEYIDGFLEVLPMPTPQHQKILKLLVLAFSQYFDARGGEVLFAPLRIRIRRGKYREPDLVLFLAAGDPRGRERFWDGADLALEVVSEDKPERDLVDKRGDYAEARIPEYWIVNPQSETITVLRLRENTYEEAGIYKRGQLAASVSRPEFTVAVSAVFDSAQLKKAD